jgi:Arc/MetJ-type ribon-helix-helix transcriptional regulator
VVIGAALVIAFAMILVGMKPYIIDIFLFAFFTLGTGGTGLTKYLRSLDRGTGLIPRATWLKVVLPLAAVLGFGTLFVCANPDEAKTIVRWLGQGWNSLANMLYEFSPTAPEYLLWLASAWIAGGLLRPLVRNSVFAAEESAGIGEEPVVSSSSEAALYAAFRNTLIALIVLFAAYLAFEYKTLWGRVFPQGFYYAGYAHEGAAWLTLALALATGVLSAILRGGVLRDPRLPRLRKLAWIWSVENLLLAVAVYHRMNIYIGFNGMTRMRTVGLLGMTAVVVGFLLVVYKIMRGRSFAWLINRQLWTLAAAIYLYLVIPVDALAHAYNVRRVLAGDLAPSVQISVHPIDSAGILVLHPLVNCTDEAIREGVRALLAERAIQGEETERQRASQNWTSFQLADRMLLGKLRANRADWEKYQDAGQRETAIARFKSYAYQWY